MKRNESGAAARAVCKPRRRNATNPTAIQIQRPVVLVVVDQSPSERGSPMRRVLALALVLVAAQPALATGLLIPTEKKLPPLALLSHQVDVTIEDQVGVTTIEQVFRNHTDRQLEATYIFPVPK